MKLTLFINPEHRSAEDIGRKVEEHLDQVRLARHLGYDGITIGHHLLLRFLGLAAAVRDAGEIGRGGAGHAHRNLHAAANLTVPIAGIRWRTASSAIRVWFAVSNGLGATMSASTRRSFIPAIAVASSFALLGRMR